MGNLIGDQEFNPFDIYSWKLSATIYSLSQGWCPNQSFIKVS